MAMGRSTRMQQLHQNESKTLHVKLEVAERHLYDLLHPSSVTQVVEEEQQDSRKLVKKAKRAVRSGQVLPSPTAQATQADDVGHQDLVPLCTMSGPEVFISGHDMEQQDSHKLVKEAKSGVRSGPPPPPGQESTEKASSEDNVLLQERIASLQVRQEAPHGVMSCPLSTRTTCLSHAHVAFVLRAVPCRLWRLSRPVVYGVSLVLRSSSAIVPTQ